MQLTMSQVKLVKYAKQLSDTGCLTAQLKQAQQLKSSKETAMSATYTIAPGLSASITSTSSDISSTDEDSRMVIGLNASF